MVIEASAWVHDIYDHKYTSEGPSNLKSLLAGFDDGVVDRIVEVVSKVGYTQHRKGGEVSIETRCIRDADYLDAVGAFGVLRTAAYAAHSGTALHLPADHSERGSSCIQHFHDKLLKLRGMVTTDLGRGLMQKRHEFLVTFLNQLEAEVIENSCVQERNG